MVRRLSLVLLLGAGLAVAQEDDSGISVDEAPPPGSEEPAKDEKTAKAGEGPRTTAYPARVPDKKVETVVIKKKVYSVALPADWVLQPFDDAVAVLAWEVLLPGSTKRAEFYLLRDEGSDPRSLPYYHAEWFRKEQPDATTEVRPKPTRLVVRRTTNGTERMSMYTSVGVRNNTFTLQLVCSPDDFAQAEADVLAAVRTFTAEVEQWPPIPKGYVTSQEGAWLIARAPQVTASIAPLVRALKDAEKRFRRDHGPLPKGDAPIVVLVHPSKGQAEKVYPKAAESKNDHFIDWQGRRLFAVPIAKDNVEQETILSSPAQGILFWAKYGDTRPAWIHSGECMVAQAEVHCGKQLPSLGEGMVAWYATLNLHTIDELEALAKADQDTWNKEVLLYVAALREGKYKKQYRAYLDDFSDTGDALGAYTRHLAPIDQSELRDSTNKFFSTRIKVEKQKH